MATHVMAAFVDPVALLSAAAGGLAGLLFLAHHAFKPTPRRVEVRSRSGR